MMNEDQFLEVVRLMVAEAVKSEGGELKSRQVKGLITIMAGLTYGLIEQVSDLTKRVKELENPVAS